MRGHTLTRRRAAAFALVPLVVLFLAGEAAGRLLERYAGYMPRRRAAFANANPYLRTALVPGARFRSHAFRVEVNSLGFRGPEIAVPKPPGTYRIFALGESSTFGWKGVSSHEDAWPAVLERKLREAHPGRAIEVVNAGVPGNTSVEQRVNFMLRVSRLQPDAIVIYHGNNDINWSWVPEVGSKLVYGRDAVPPGHSAWNRLLEHSYVFLELRSQLSHASAAGLVKHDEPDPAALAMLRWNLAGLVDETQRSGAAVAIATFAHAVDESGRPGELSDLERRLNVGQLDRWFDHLSIQGVRRTFPLYNAMVADIASATGVPLCDVRASVAPTFDNFTDWCHLTARGNEAVAQAWFQTIEAAGWLRQPASRPGTTP